MMHKLIAALLALTLVSWAQSTTTPNQAPEQQKSAPADAKAGCPCCADTPDHADAHKGMACMRHAATGKDDKEASCCSKKDGKHSCCGKDMKACSKDEKTSRCDEKCEESCRSAKDGKPTAQNCCAEKQCGRHGHHDSATPGN